MILWQANLGRGVDRYVFEHNLRNILEAAGPRAVICFQEVDEADAPEEMDILVRLTQNTHYIVGPNTAVPILVPRRIEILGDHQIIGCRGLAKFTPHRPINEAILRVSRNLKVAVENTHLPLDRVQTLTRRQEVRRKLRAQCRARQDELMAGVWVADTNTHRGWPTIAQGESIVINAGIDKSKAWAPPGRRVVVEERQSVDLTIDGHNAHGARIRWVREAA